MIKTIVNFIKGYSGEKRTSKINQKLNKKLNNDLICIDGLTLKKTNSHNGMTTTQIDHILISKSTSEIIVVETKNYNSKGIITGDVSERKWKSNYFDKQEYEVNNPLFQNYGHIKTIQDLIKHNLNLHIPLENFKSLIFYNGNTQIKITDNNPKDDKLFDGKNIVNNENDYMLYVKNVINNSSNYKKVDLSNKDINNIAQMLTELNLTNGLNFSSIIASSKHKNEIKKNVKKY